MTDYLAHGYEYVERLGRFRDLTTGRFVAERSILSQLERVTADASTSMEAITERLLNDETSIPEWQQAMEREILSVNRMGALVSRGGWSRMDQSDWGFAGSWIKKQYQWLDKFARELVNGKQKLNGTALTRAKLYAQAGRGLYQEMKRRQAKKRGKAEEMRVLGPNENHCQTNGLISGCIELAAKGWQPIGTLPPIGESPCYTNCLCVFRFR